MKTYQEHAEEAERLLDSYDAMERTAKVRGVPDATLSMALSATQQRAQVHASLALAAVQQEANAIARAQADTLARILDTGTGDHGFQVTVMS